MKIRNTLLSVVVASAFTASAFASSNVGVINLDNVFKATPQGTAAFTQLKTQLTPQVQAFQTQQTNLQQKMTTFQSDKKMTKAEKAAKKTQLLAQQQELQTSMQAFQASAQKQQQALLATFSDSVKAAAATVAKNDDLSVIITSQNAIYNTPDSDVTNEVIAIMEKAAPVAARS